MKKMNYIIVDDEPLAHDIILSYAEPLEELALIGQAHTATEALKLLKSHSIDLIFLDIEMPKLKGIDLLATLTKKPLVILTTAYEKYALKGYELDVVDYLLKPFSLQRFIQAINKAYDLWNPKLFQEQLENGKKLNSIFVKSDKTIHQLQIDNILYLESDEGYVKLHLVNGKSILSNMSLQEFEEKLPVAFLRIHKSCIVSIPKIDKLEGNQVVIGANKLPIGRSYKKILLKQLGF